MHSATAEANKSDAFKKGKLLSLFLCFVKCFMGLFIILIPWSFFLKYFLLSLSLCVLSSWVFGVAHLRVKVESNNYVSDNVVNVTIKLWM